MLPVARISAPVSRTANTQSLHASRFTLHPTPPARPPTRGPHYAPWRHGPSTRCATLCPPWNPARRTRWETGLGPGPQRMRSAGWTVAKAGALLGIGGVTGARRPRQEDLNKLQGSLDKIYLRRPLLSAISRRRRAGRWRKRRSRRGQSRTRRGSGRSPTSRKPDGYVRSPLRVCGSGARDAANWN
jgi:hypothetical protein